MGPYLETARRYWWLLGVVALLVLGPGLAMAYDEYTHSYESEATIWTQNVLRRISPANDPNAATLDAPATEQSDALAQLLRTRSFLIEIVSATSLRADYGASPDPTDYLADVGRRFRVQRLGTNLIQVAYRARQPGVAAEMVQAAINARFDRGGTSQVEQTSVPRSFLQSQYDAAKSALRDAQAQLDQFAAQHRSPLTSLDESQQRQLTVSLELAQTRVQDLKTQIDRAASVAALQQVAQQMDFQIIDQPRPGVRGSGGLRPAASIAGVAAAIGLMLMAVLVVGLTLLRLGIASEAQLAQLSSGAILAAIPVVKRSGSRRAAVDLRDALAAEAFGAAVDPRPEPTPAADRQLLERLKRSD